MVKATLFSLIVFFACRPIIGQSCSTSCPLNNGCTGGGFGGPECGPAHGSDPYCYTYNPDPCKYPNSNGCAPGEYYSSIHSCCYRVSSPILIDVTGDGFHLTDPGHGVWFKVFPDRAEEFQIAWPSPQSHNGWLVLDRNKNGKIDDFTEFFGDLTPQPDPPPGQRRNGFLALKVYDQPDHGGNDDGLISGQDEIYDKLRVWIDDNHDGVSQPEELHTLASLGIAAIGLDYTYSKMVDEFGNEFRYRSQLWDSSGGEANKTIYDVYLVLGLTRPDLTSSPWTIRRQPLNLY